VPYPSGYVANMPDPGINVNNYFHDTKKPTPQSADRHQIIAKKKITIPQTYRRKREKRYHTMPNYTQGIDISS